DLAGIPQDRFRFDGCETLVPEDTGQTGDLLQPGAELSRFGGGGAFVAVGVHRQADHQGADFLRLDHLTKIAGVLLGIAARVGRQRRSEPALRVADRQADAHAAVIDAEQSRAAHRYFSRPFFLSSSTRCLILPSSRRSATRMASPSWMMSRLSTPMVAISRPGSPTTTQFFVF